MIYKDNKDNKNNNVIIRTFDENIDPTELMWHRDKNDRIVKSLYYTEWKIQLDDELPINLNKSVFIKKEQYHRLIKGTNNCQLQIIEL